MRDFLGPVGAVALHASALGGEEIGRRHQWPERLRLRPTSDDASLAQIRPPLRAGRPAAMARRSRGPGGRAEMSIRAVPASNLARISSRSASRSGHRGHTQRAASSGPIIVVEMKNVDIFLEARDDAEVRLLDVEEQRAARPDIRPTRWSRSTARRRRRWRPSACRRCSRRRRGRRRRRRSCCCRCGPASRCSRRRCRQPCRPCGPRCRS